MPPPANFEPAGGPGLGSPDDVVARLRLRGRLASAEAQRLAEEAEEAGGPAAAGGIHRRPRLRLAPSRWAVVGVGIALAGVVAWFVVVAWGGGVGSGPVAAPASTVWEQRAALLGEPSSTGAGALSETPAVVVVHVAGAVAEPGVFELPAGARAADAVERAGGALPEADLAALNLAAPLVDGERLYVPLPGETPPPVVNGGVASGGGSGSAVGGDGRIAVNSASAEDLTALPGIGPVLAARIVAFREANGPFRELADLGEVSGIGPKILAGLADSVAF